MTQKAFIEVELTLLSKEEGGRANPIPLDHEESRYMPHIVIGDPNQREVICKPGTNEIVEEYLGVCFRRYERTIYSGETVNLILDLMYYPQLKYTQVEPNATFTLREGGLIAGYGKVLSVNFSE